MKDKIKAIGYGYWNFINKKNIGELAIAFIMGLLINELTKSLITSFVTPLLLLISGGSPTNTLSFTINNIIFPYGNFVQAVINFLFISLIIYLIFVLIVKYQKKRVKPEVKKPTTEELLQKQINLLTLLLMQSNPNYQEELVKLEKKQSFSHEVGA